MDAVTKKQLEIIATKMTRDISGILHTKTLVTLEAQAKIDLEKVFNI